MAHTSLACTVNASHLLHLWSPILGGVGVCSRLQFVTDNEYGWVDGDSNWPPSSLIAKAATKVPMHLLFYMNKNIGIAFAIQNGQMAKQIYKCRENFIILSPRG